MLEEKENDTVQQNIEIDKAAKLCGFALFDTVKKMQL